MITILHYRCICGNTLHIMTDFEDTREQCSTCNKAYNVTPYGTVTPHVKRNKRVTLKNVFNIATGRRLRVTVTGS